MRSRHLRRQVALGSLVATWTVLTLLLVLAVVLHRDKTLWAGLGLLGLWATNTLLIVRRLWPRSVLARIPVGRDHGRPVAHGPLYVVAALVAALVLVVAVLLAA